MESSSTWSQLLTSQRAGPPDRAPDGAIDARLHDLVDAIIGSARRAWPTVELCPEQFIGHLARQLPANVSLEAALQQLHTDDLYLARACALGDKRAILAFEHHCMAGLERALARYRAFSDLAEEVKQRVRAYVLLGDADGDAGPPGIASFSGRGDLRSWVRIIAVRRAVDLVRQARREIAVDDDALLHAFATAGDAGLERAKTRYVEEFKRAFGAALRALPAHDQVLLRQHAIDGLTIDQLGALHRVHRATAARSLQRARRALLHGTRKRLTSQLRVTPSELDSVLRMIRSRLEVSLRWLVRRRRPRAS